jgi:hypothetical protein
VLQQRVLLWLHGHGDGELLHKKVDQQQFLSQEEELSCIINSSPAKKINPSQQLFSQVDTSSTAMYFA